MYHEFSVLAVVLNCSQKVKQAVLVNMRQCRPPNSQIRLILVQDVAMIEYHNQNKVKELTLILSISAGEVLMCQDPSRVSLQVDCCVS